MEITTEQYSRIEGYFPTQRGNVKNENLQILNAILYVCVFSKSGTNGPDN